MILRLSSAVFVCCCGLFAAAGNHWVVTWGASPSPLLADDAQRRKAHLEFENQTIREIVHTSIGGNTIRVRLSNVFGTRALEIGGAQVALRAKDSAIVSGSSHELTFSGRPAIIVPPNAFVLSDPVQLALNPASDLAVSIFLPHAATGSGIHYAAQQTAYIGAGDQAKAPAIESSTNITSWVFLAGVDVEAPASVGAVVTFGDSITDGARSTNDTNRRWPNIMANRLQASGQKLGVLDAGIGGNRILHDAHANLQFGVNALARFDRDALDQPGVKYVILLEGINDLGHAGGSEPMSDTVSADDLIAGMKQLIQRAHSRGIKIFGGTLTPFDGTPFPGYFTPEKEVKRKALNEWIRTSKVFDGVVDFEKAVRDPANPDHILATFDGGDHLHPGDAGYKAMGEAVDLKLFK